MAGQVLVIQHNSWERPGLIGVALAVAGLGYESRMVFDDPAPELPQVKDLAGLVVMGGAMGARDYDAYPGLAAEARLLRLAVDADLPVLGVCLGHQLIASALGAQLHPGATAEFGIGPVDVIAADPVTDPLGTSPQVLHWHRDAVDVPEGATLLARTEQCPNQAFRAGSAVGLQFHLEVDSQLLSEWVTIRSMRADLPEDVARRIAPDLRAAETTLVPTAMEAFGAFASTIKNHAD